MSSGQGDNNNSEADNANIDAQNNWKRSQNSVDDETTGILATLVQGTNRFYAPKQTGPRGPNNPPQVQKLRIATIATPIKLPLKGKDEVSYHHRLFDSHKDLKAAQAALAEALKKDPNHPAKGAFEGLHPSAFARLTMFVPDDDFKFEWCRQLYRDGLERARRDKADAVCFAEMAFPHPAHHIDEWPAHITFVQELQDFANDNDMVIIAGSYHDLQTQTNECAIFLPLRKNSRGKVSVTDSNQSPRYYTKRVPAQLAGEIVRRPPKTGFPHYESKFGNFAVLICFDSFDPTLFLRFLAWHHSGLDSRQGRIEAEMKVIFVPSYSDNSKGWNPALDLSYATRSVVVYVDGPYENTKAAVAVCGSTIKASGKHGFKEDGDYAIWEIDWNDFMDERADLRDEQENSAIWQALEGKKARRGQVTRANLD